MKKICNRVAGGRHAWALCGQRIGTSAQDTGTCGKLWGKPRPRPLERGPAAGNIRRLGRGSVRQSPAPSQIQPVDAEKVNVNDAMMLELGPLGRLDPARPYL